VQENKERAMNWLGEIRLGEMQFLHIAKDGNNSQAIYLSQGFIHLYLLITA
jgi:hypothetical protein